MKKLYKEEASKEIFIKGLEAGLDVHISCGPFEVQLDPRSNILDETLDITCLDPNERVNIENIKTLIEVLQGGLDALEEVKDRWKPAKNE